MAQMENRNESGKTEHDKVFRLTQLLMTTMRFKILFLEWKLYFIEVRSVKKKCIFLEEKKKNTIWVGISLLFIFVNND